MSNDVVMCYFPLYAVSCIYSSVSIIMMYEGGFQLLQLKVPLIKLILKRNRKPVIILLFSMKEENNMKFAAGNRFVWVTCLHKLGYFSLTLR